jgi:hypothetical protein
VTLEMAPSPRSQVSADIVGNLSKIFRASSHVATVVRWKSNLRPNQVGALARRGGDGSVIAVIAGSALSAGILALAVLRGKDQMQRIEHICAMYRDSFWM